MKNAIISKILGNKRFEKIERTVKVLSKKYGPITASGGSLVDCYFDMEFYDIDLFISVKDLKDEYKKQYTSKTHILDVLRDKFEGEEIDIIVVDYSVKEHISRFDQNFKKIWYDGQLHIDKKAIKDIENNSISLGTVNGPVVYFRIIKSAKKYGMELNDDDIYLLQNYLSCLRKINVSEKYKNMLDDFNKMNNPNYTLGHIVGDFTEYYWKKNMKKIPTWTILKTVLMPAMMMMKLNK